MDATNIDRRRFSRHVIPCGLLFSDHDGLIGMAQVVELSRCGVWCVSLTPVDCITCTVEDIELFGSDEDLYETDVGGRMTRCSTKMLNSNSPSETGHYEFAFEFFPRYYDQIERLEKVILSK